MKEALCRVRVSVREGVLVCCKAAQEQTEEQRVRKGQSNASQERWQDRDMGDSLRAPACQQIVRGPIGVRVGCRSEDGH